MSKRLDVVQWGESFGLSALDRLSEAHMNTNAASNAASGNLTPASFTDLQKASRELAAAAAAIKHGPPCPYALAEKHLRKSVTYSLESAQTIANTQFAKATVARINVASHLQEKGTTEMNLATDAMKEIGDD